jgi:hypothetical protein
MKTNVTIGIVIVTMMMVLAACGSVMAARPVPAGNESSTITVTTSARVVGNFLESNSLALQQSTDILNPPLADGEQIGVVGYSEETMAVNGDTNYQKRLTVNNANANVAQDNLQVDRIIEFDAGPGGRMVSDENVLVSTVATANQNATGCCPWGSTTDATLPAEHEVVVAGSSMDVSEVSAHTSSDARVISNTPGTPVTLDYEISAQGINQTTPGDVTNAAVGSATAYVSGKIESSTGNNTAQGADMEYHDVTSVDGLFDLSKEVHYSSAPGN